MLRAQVLALCLATTACAARPAAALPSWVDAKQGVRYAGHAQTVLDVLQPAGKTEGLRPGAIVIHGGGWGAGHPKRMIAQFCLPLVEQGFVVANVGYRLTRTAPAPAAIVDVLQAARWFRKHAGRFRVDPRRIIVIGMSAGAHLALMVGMAPGSAGFGPAVKVAAVVNWYGITDLTDQIAGPNQRSYAQAWVPPQPGRMALARRVSPMTYVRVGLPPILTIHGEADEVVPLAHGERLTRALRAVGVAAKLIRVPGGEHGFTPSQMRKLFPAVFAFLRARRVLPAKP